MASRSGRRDVATVRLIGIREPRSCFAEVGDGLTRCLCFQGGEESTIEGVEENVEGCHGTIVPRSAASSGRDHLNDRAVSERRLVPISSPDHLEVNGDGNALVRSRPLLEECTE